MGVSSLTSPTRGLELIRTPGVMRKQEYAKRGTRDENILTFDTRLLQDIISGRWTRQQLYGSTPSWYQDSFYNIILPSDNRPRGYEIPVGDQRPALNYDYQPQPFAIGPLSDISSTVGPPSTVGPLVSIAEHPSPKKKLILVSLTMLEMRNIKKPKKKVQLLGNHSVGIDMGQLRTDKMCF